MAMRRPGDGDDRDLSWLDSSWAEDLSRDGRLLLFSESGQGGGGEGAAYLRGTDGSPAVRLGAGRASALSPDARWAISFSSSVPSPYLDLLPTGAGESRRLPGNNLGYFAARWLPDGKRIVVWAAEPGRPPRLYLQQLEQGAPKALTPEGISFWWVVSPDGSTIAANGPGPGVHLYPVDGTTSRDLLGMAGGETPIGWINDGLLITKPRDPASPLGQVYLVDPGSGRQQPWKNILPRDRAGIMAFISFRATPDGASHVYTWHRALSDLYVADGLA
jgi:hypothetical protein